jgi:hypothetical protein
MYLEVKAKSGDNTQGADTAAAVSAYNARKRSVGLRAVLLLVPIAVLTAIWSPILGFDLVLGGLCGIGNMWLVMRNNERLLDGRRSRGVYGATNLARILGVGFAPVVSAMTGPWWSMGIALAGFFTPLVLYAFALRREFSTG